MTLAAIVALLFFAGLFRQIATNKRKHRAEREAQRIVEEKHRDHLRQIEAREAKQRMALEEKERKTREAQRKAEQKRMEAEQKKADHLQMLAERASLAEIDAEHLQTILDRQEREYIRTKGIIDLFESASATASEKDYQAFERASRIYHATLKKYLKAQNTIEAYKACLAI